MRTEIQFPITPLAAFGLILCVILTSPAHGIDKPYPGPFVENDHLLVVLIPHTPDQMAAFYEARGFSAQAIDLIRETCFVTVHIENKSRKVIWLEIDNWHFSSDNKPLLRLGDDYWNTPWNDVELPQANRSTFGWTLLPEVRDLQPDEPVGGNIVFHRPVDRFNIKAHFMTGRNKRSGMIDVNFENIECPQDEPTQ